MKQKLLSIKQRLFTKVETTHSEQFNETVRFFNKYSYLFHALFSCAVVFIVELVSRRSLFSAIGFISETPITYLYNAFIVFASLSLVYLFRRRGFARLIVCSFWIILGIINGVVLCNRVTPFNFSDLACIPDLLALSGTSYITPSLIIAILLASSAFILACVVFYIQGPVFTGKTYRIRNAFFILSMIFIAIPITTKMAQDNKIVETYFANIAQGYEDYGFVYSFSTGVLDRGMDKPGKYSQETIQPIIDSIVNGKEETTITADTAPNIICVLLESFVDPDEFNFMTYSQDPAPFYHYLRDNFTSGYVTMPVVGAGTANAEFEILTGMKLQYFGTGEYPYKTILKETDCESVAAVLKNLGYGTHAVHNNGGNFYSRVNAFSMMGFDTFTSKELMDITEFTPNGWAEDAILVEETMKTLLSTPNQPDFTYTITVGTHGTYPTESILEDPYCEILGIDNEELTNQWTYYMHQLNKTDQFIEGLIRQLEQLDEDTIVVFWGDHLPTMGLEDEDMVSGDIYKTSYVTWNNFGLEKEDCDLYAYQLMADILDTIGIHEGTMIGYHQTQAGVLDEETYINGIEQLQYDILYGERYCYEDGISPYPPTEIVMGLDEVVIDHVELSKDGKQYIITGQNFTQWSRVYIDNTKIKPTYVSSTQLIIEASSLKEDSTIVVSQVGSNNTRFRNSNEYKFVLKGTSKDLMTEEEVPEKTIDK
ncbi:MAG: LTA synthase family protein [Agathobacter sp.]|nr:LTA synthase family protein [Agathobacter sp.]